MSGEATANWSGQQVAYWNTHNDAQFQPAVCCSWQKKQVIIALQRRLKQIKAKANENKVKAKKVIKAKKKNGLNLI